MHLLFLAVGIVLFPKVFTTGDILTCHECIPGISGSCTAITTKCSTAAHQCASLRLLTYAGGSKISDIQAQSCILPQECIEGSVNFGVAKTVISSKCCDTNLCNTQPAPDAGQSTPNGKKCFTCEGETCTKTLNCEGSEDRCIKSTVTVEKQKVTIKGCASKLMCEAASNPQLSGVMGAEPSCCQGDLCNSASSASAGLLMLVVPLTSLVFLS